MPTVAGLLKLGASRLVQSPSAMLDAELLLMHATRLSRTQLITRAHEPLQPVAVSEYEALLARRERGEPIAYIVGVREFWSIPLRVTPAVLIPRPETELLVEAVLKHVGPDRPARIADLGTGSGAVAIAIARERPLALVVATDASTEALAVAADNVARHHCRNIVLRQGEWCSPLEGRFDVIASNPPYVRLDDPHLQEGDVRFEPRGALVAGSDGLDAIRAIARCARDHLAPGGWLVLEHGFDQKEAVQATLRTLAYHDIDTLADNAGLDRVTAARWNTPG